jgi:hypothetical protein
MIRVADFNYQLADKIKVNWVFLRMKNITNRGGSFQLPASWQNQSELSVFENEKYNEQGSVVELVIKLINHMISRNYMIHS